MFRTLDSYNTRGRVLKGWIQYTLRTSGGLTQPRNLWTKFENTLSIDSMTSGCRRCVGGYVWRLIAFTLFVVISGVLQLDQLYGLKELRENGESSLTKRHSYNTSLHIEQIILMDCPAPEIYEKTIRVRLIALDLQCYRKARRSRRPYSMKTQMIFKRTNPLWPMHHVACMYSSSKTKCVPHGNNSVVVLN